MSDSPNDFCARTDHRRHTPGADKHPDWQNIMRLANREYGEVSNRLVYCTWMDKAWTVMLCRQGIITHETAKKLLGALADTSGERGFGGEDWIKEKLGGDEYTAGAVNLGRTLQEPMARLQMREKLLDLIDALHEAMATTLDKADENADAIMAGQSHFSHAQPTTYGAYLVAVHDGLARGLAQVELAYRHTNQNSGGCGACSGTGWPVDRQLVTELLGFDELIELTYDCEASQDEIPQICFAASSIALTLARAALDHGRWSLEEVGSIALEPQWLGVSSFMPQKAHTGGMFENVRRPCNDAIGQMMTAVVTFKGEALQDNLPVFQAPPYALMACCKARQALTLWAELLKAVIVHRDRMWEIVRNGYSGAPDLAIRMIRDQDYGARQAHRICCNAVRLARERGIKPYEVTGELLDEAARVTSEPEPHLTTEQVQDAIGLESFLEKHRNVGDPHPDETRRLIGTRREQLEEFRSRQAERRSRIEQANERLEREIRAILGGTA
jgi:argininosuccinate lyase